MKIEVFWNENYACAMRGQADDKPCKLFKTQAVDEIDAITKILEEVDPGLLEEIAEGDYPAITTFTRLQKYFKGRDTSGGEPIVGWFSVDGQEYEVFGDIEQWFEEEDGDGFEDDYEEDDSYTDEPTKIKGTYKDLLGGVLKFS